MDRIDLQVVIVYAGVYSKAICTHAQGTCVWEGLNRMHVDTSEGGAVMSKVWFPECPLFGGKNTLQNRFGTEDSAGP